MKCPPPDATPVPETRAMSQTDFFRASIARCRTLLDSSSSVLADRKAHHKSGACTRTALDRDRPTVGLHRVFDDRQTETGAAGVSRSVFVDTIKTLENMRLVAQRDTHAIVGILTMTAVAIAAKPQW